MEGPPLSWAHYKDVTEKKGHFRSFGFSNWFVKMFWSVKTVVAPVFGLLVLFVVKPASG